ncbi:PREDICTED: golgin IMH1-like isoform X2 [Bactrocera latifrons]|uniref:golgin IMH1-like isoform X2 n=1 Tax=Bactrocera latifrons TaxID=174628 RepID=UPI0008DD266B|nr:PREDICTED: golgin IMH1-like isoform X2 [Bactrocera latifrons]
MKCSVVGCSSDYMKNPLKKTFYGFPTDAAVAHKWVLFCQQPKDFNYRSKFICRDHFKDDDFLNIAQFKMGFALRLKIKRDAVPTIRRISTGQTIRELRIQRRNQKQIVNDLLRKYNQEQKVKIKLAASEFDEICSTQSTKGSSLVANNTNSNGFDEISTQATKGPAPVTNKEDTVEQIELTANGYDEISTQTTKGLGLVADNTNDKEDSVEQIDFVANVFDEICSTRATKGLRPVKTGIKNKLSDFAVSNDKDNTISEDYIHNEVQFEEVTMGNQRDYPINVFEEVDELREQIKLLRKDNICQRRINKGLCKKLEKWKRLNIEKDIRYANRLSRLNVRLKNKTQECKNLEEKLNSIFTSGQINKMKSLKLNYQWDEEDIAKSLILYRSSGKTYKLLYDNGFPMPSVRTLQRWIWNNKIDPKKDVNITATKNLRLMPSPTTEILNTRNT